jgi:hypothetical protein
VRTVDELPHRGFVGTLSGGVQIFLQEPLAKLAVDKKTSIRIDVTGFWKWKSLRATGLDPYLI